MGDHDNRWVAVRLRIRNLVLFTIFASSLPTKRKEMADILEQYSSLSLSSNSSEIKVVLGKIISGNQANLHPDSPPRPYTHPHSWSGGLRQWNPDFSHRAFAEGYQLLCAESQIWWFEDLDQRFRLHRSIHVATLYSTQPTDAAQAVLALKMLCRNPAGSDLITRPSTLSSLISAAEVFRDTPNATSEVLRCIANGLLLIVDSRSTFVTKEVGGGPAVLGMLEVRIGRRRDLHRTQSRRRGQLRPTSYL